MPNSSSTLNLWEGIARELKLLFPEDLYGMWFQELRCVEQSNDKLVLEAPNEFNAIWIESNYLDVITQQARAHAGTAITVTVQAEADKTTAPTTNRLDVNKSSFQRAPKSKLTIIEDILALQGKPIIVFLLIHVILFRIS